MPPSLDQLTIDLASGRVSAAEACRIAREVTGGTRMKLAHGVQQRVLLADPQAQLERLNALINERPPSDPCKWAGTLLLTHALLGTADVAGGARPAEQAAFDMARGVVERVVARSAGKCPAGAVTFATSLVDAILKHPLCVDGKLQSTLLRARRSYQDCGESGGHQQSMSRVFEVVISCFEQQHWQYIADHAERTATLGFFCPLGATRLVVRVSDPARLDLFALDVIAVPEHQRTQVERALQKSHSGIEAHYLPDRDTVTLSCALRLEAGSLTTDRILQAVIHVNGAAESLLLMRA